MSSQSDPSPVLLDTHAWIWFVEEDRQITGSPSLRRILRAYDQSRLAVSAISLWELAMLDSKGRVRLETDCLTWIREALSRPEIDLIALTPEIAVESNRLPGHLPGDPADRIIVATARVLKGTLVTADERLIDYGKQGFLNILAV